MPAIVFLLCRLGVVGLALVVMPIGVLAEVPQPTASALPTTIPKQDLLPYPADENWGFLRDPKSRTDPFDAIKFIPIGSHGAYISVGGSERVYYEAFVNENLGQIPGSDSYIQSQSVFHVGIVPDRNLRLYGSLQYDNLGHRPGGPRPGMDADYGDVLETFAEIRSQQYDESTGDAAFAARIGRQQLDFGAGRLFSGRTGPNGDGTNVLGSFDGFRLIIHSSNIRVDAFAVRPVNNPVGSFDDGSSAGNGTWGLYATRGNPNSGTPVVDAYYFGLSRPQAVWYSGSGFEIRHTVGARIAKMRGPFDYDCEAFYQFGVNGVRPIAAEGVSGQGGYTFMHAGLTPRIAVLAGFNSGGGDAHELRDMYAPFPRGGYFGNLRAIGPQNTEALEGRLDLHPTRDVTISGGSYAFWRSSRQDGVYNLDGTELAPPSNNEHAIGYQPFIELAAHVNAHLSLVVDEESLQRGEFLEHIPGTKPTYYTASWAEFRF